MNPKRLSGTRGTPAARRTGAFSSYEDFVIFPGIFKNGQIFDMMPFGTGEWVPSRNSLMDAVGEYVRTYVPTVTIFPKKQEFRDLEPRALKIDWTFRYFP